LLETKTNSLEKWLNNYLQIHEINNKKDYWNEWIKKNYPNEDLSNLDKKTLRKLKNITRVKILRTIEPEAKRQIRLQKQRKRNKDNWEKKRKNTEKNKITQDFFNDGKSKSDNQNQESNSQAQSPQFLSNHKSSGFCACSICKNPGPSRQM
jgi:hypothetical protein